MEGYHNRETKHKTLSDNRQENRYQETTKSLKTWSKRGLKEKHIGITKEHI